MLQSTLILFSSTVQNSTALYYILYKACIQSYSDSSPAVPQDEGLAVSLRYEHYHEGGLDSAHRAEEYEEAGVTDEINDGAGGLNRDEDHEELEGDDGAAHERLQIRGEPLS